MVPPVPEHAPDGRVERPSPWRFLLLIPFVAVLWVPFYNHPLPALGGFPFFYWYQLLAVPVSALIIFIVYRMENRMQSGGTRP